MRGTALAWLAALLESMGTTAHTCLIRAVIADSTDGRTAQSTDRLTRQRRHSHSRVTVTPESHILASDGCEAACRQSPVRVTTLDRGTRIASRWRPLRCRADQARSRSRNTRARARIHGEREEEGAGGRERAGARVRERQRERERERERERSSGGSWHAAARFAE